MYQPGHSDAAAGWYRKDIGFYAAPGVDAEVQGQGPRHAHLCCMEAAVPGVCRYPSNLTENRIGRGEKSSCLCFGSLHDSSTVLSCMVQTLHCCLCTHNDSVVSMTPQHSLNRTSQLVSGLYAEPVVAFAMVAHHRLGQLSQFRHMPPNILKMITRCVKQNQKEQRPRLIRELARSTQIDHRVPVRLLS